MSFNVQHFYNSLLKIAYFKVTTTSYVYIFFKSRGYHLHTVKEYGKILESAGFVDVQATNMTPGFIDILKGEVSEFSQKKEAIINEFSQKDFDYIVTGWNDKIKRCSDGDQAWGYFVAKKPYA